MKYKLLGLGILVLSIAYTIITKEGTALLFPGGIGLICMISDVEKIEKENEE